MSALWIVALILCGGSWASGQALAPTSTPAQQQSPVPHVAPVQPQQVDWRVKMGVRSFQNSARVMVIDKVVLVPDGATYLDEVGMWTLRGRWPVLIEDDIYTPLFVRAFKPSKVIRRTSVGALAATEDERRVAARNALTRAWTVPGSDANPRTPSEAFASVRTDPIGIVFTNMSDPAWPAAVALAAGHGQVLNWIDGSFDLPSATMTATQLQELSAHVEAVALATKLPYAALGDVIDAVTICQSMPAKAVVAPGAQWAPPKNFPSKLGEPIAVTDALCRNADGTRWAVAAWIFGSEARSAYMAMSSLFLTPRSVWLMNTYPTDGDWGQYAVTGATTGLATDGYETTEYSGMQTSEFAWRNLLMGGFKADVLYMNTMGNMDFFNLWNSVAAHPEDVPLLNHPMALHLIHSWSLTSPESRETVGGRWLENGVYAYAGSVFEPFLPAFVPPAKVAFLMSNWVPFLVASRWCEGPLDATWRVTTIGDPLMVITSPSQPVPARGATFTVNAAAGESDVKESARSALVAAKSSNAAADYARAFTDVVHYGDDVLAVQLWSIAASKSPEIAAACAPIALGSLFRQRESSAFLAAYRLTAKPSPSDQDMLWHLFTPQLSSIKDRDLLKWFETQVRPARPEIDRARLAPELKRITEEQGMKQ